MVENEREGIMRRRLPRRKLLQSALAGAAAGLMACESKDNEMKRKLLNDARGPLPMA
jgi:type IV pilus biogenesis protein CpaD/CtpE